MECAVAAAAGIQGHRIYIDEDGDAEANYTVVALLRDERQSDPEMAGKSLQPLGHFMLRQHDIPVRLHVEWTTFMISVHVAVVATTFELFIILQCQVSFLGLCENASSKRRSRLYNDYCRSVFEYLYIIENWHSSKMTKHPNSN